ncbi:hypothetical protein BCR44DRAFT_250499 [Catenaria anguillulae PL171]|uniref:Transcription factor domain-containing protein n=1 Tax=Catenaria anguillulae PL171 TaxID=765915 RepID=A0A1Y2HA60_9FUNG|nr:hypothetical protein BCR44DRAFT_250499 [Catenaria anguillulae PL171]
MRPPPPPPPRYLQQTRHDLAPFPVLSTVRAAVQLFSKLAVSALVPDSVRKWCASQPFDAPAWHPTHAPDHIEPIMQRSMSFALGLAITVFVYRTCGPESLSARGTPPTSIENGTSSGRIAPPLVVDEVLVADWMTTTVGIAMHEPCAMDPELGSGDCHFARGLAMYLLAYAELTAGNVPTARRLCLAALDVLQEEAVGSPSSTPSLPTVFQKCEVYLSISTLYHTLSVATRVPGGRSSEMVNEYERLLSDPAVAATALAGGLGDGVSLAVHLDLLSLIARAVDMSSAPRDRVHPDDRLSLLHSLQAVMVNLEAEDPFPPDEPARFAPALFVRIQTYAILIQLARPAILESLGVASDGTRVSTSHAAVPPRAPTLDSNLTYATAGLVRLSRWIASQSIDVNPFLQHSFVAATHALAPAILQAMSGVAMMIACGGRDVQAEARAAEMHHHRGAAHSLLGILHTISPLLPSPLNIVHRFIGPVSQFCARLDASANPDVIPFIVGVERDHGIGSSLLAGGPSAIMHAGPMGPPPPPPQLHPPAPPSWPTYPGHASRVPPPPPPHLHPPHSQQGHHHAPHSQQGHHHAPHSHSHHAHAPPHASQYPHLRPQAILPPTPPNASSSHSNPSNPSTPVGRIDGSVPTPAPASASRV